MFNIDLLKNLLIIAMGSSCITVLFIQKTKRFLPNSNIIIIYSLIINLILSYFFCRTFTQVNYIESIWVGLFSFLGADTIYKMLNGTLYSYNEINNNDDNSDNDNSNNDIIGEIPYE